MDPSKCAIVISSCDSYSDAWEPFFGLFFKFWPDCPYKVYLIANSLMYPDDRIITLNISPDGNWASNMGKALLDIKEEYIIYLQEDYFIKSGVDNDYLFDLLNIIIKEDAACLRIFPCPSPNHDYKDHSNVGEIDVSAPYRVSLQAAIWNKDLLLQLIKPGESAWNMEIIGTERSKNITNPFLSVKRGKTLPIDYLCTAIIKGRWTKEAVRFLQENQIKADFKKRKIESRFDFIGDFIKIWLIRFKKLLLKR